MKRGSRIIVLRSELQELGERVNKLSADCEDHLLVTKDQDVVIISLRSQLSEISTS